MKITARKTAAVCMAASAVYSGRVIAADQNDFADTSPPATPLVTALPDAPGGHDSDRSDADSSPAAHGIDSPSTAGAPADGLVNDKSAADPFAGAAAPMQVPAARPAKSVSPKDVQFDDAIGTVEIHVNDADLVEVLRMISMQSQKNIVASKQVTGRVTANLYDVTIKEALDAILMSNGYAYREQGNFIFVYTQKELDDQEKATRKQKTEVIRLYYTPAANAVNMIKPVLSPSAQVAFSAPPVSGIASGVGDSGGNAHATEDLIVVTDYPENIEQVQRIIKEVDRRPQQILIEATILRAALSEDNALGVDFQVLGGVNFSELTGAGSAFAGASSGGIINSNNTQAQGIVNDGYVAGGTAFTQNVPQGGLRMGIVKDNIAVFLQALESVTDTTILANPKVLALNKQRGEVIVGRKDGYLTTTVTDSSTVQTVEFLDTGTRLVFRPYIGDDGYIRMEIHPEDSSGGLQGAANLPFKVTTEVTSNVMVKDGHTIVIGGLFRESSDTARGQVPFLGNLPLAGALFRQQRDRTTREEVIILLTPHIVKDDNAFSQASEELLKEGEKLRVGVRRGMMPFGRERLAELNYEWARKELAKDRPDRGKVLWHLNCATNLNPKFIEAIDLKERLTGQEVTSVNNSRIRSFVREQIQADRRRVAASQPAANADLMTDPLLMPGKPRKGGGAGLASQPGGAGDASASASAATGGATGGASLFTTAGAAPASTDGDADGDATSPSTHDSESGATALVDDGSRGGPRAGGRGSWIVDMLQQPLADIRRWQGLAAAMRPLLRPRQTTVRVLEDDDEVLSTIKE